MQEKIRAMQEAAEALGVELLGYAVPTTRRSTIASTPDPDSGDPSANLGASANGPLVQQEDCGL